MPYPFPPPPRPGMQTVHDSTPHGLIIVVGAPALSADATSVGQSVSVVAPLIRHGFSSKERGGEGCLVFLLLMYPCPSV